MASFKVLASRDKAITAITVKYPNIWKLTGQAIEQWINDFIYEICAEHNVSRKTAIDYFKTAIQRRKKEIQLQNELNYEEERTLNAVAPENSNGNENSQA